MKSCRQIHNLFIDACYDELDAVSKQQFDDHLASCPECNAAFLKMQQTLNLVSEHKVPDLDEAYWDSYWERLSGNLNQKKKQPAGTRKVEFYRIPSVRWAVGVAFAFVIGIYIGRTPFKQSVTDHYQNQATQEAEVQFTSARKQAAQYLERSKLILLGITNEDLPSNFSLQQRKSAELVSQTGPLKESLSSTNQLLLVELVEELELILIQIANLENEHDIQGIELVQEGSEQRALLFKINIGEMYLSANASTDRPQNNQPTI